jgi:hypothetical protein
MKTIIATAALLVALTLNAFATETCPETTTETTNSPAPTSITLSKANNILAEAFRRYTDGDISYTSYPKDDHIKTIIKSKSEAKHYEIKFPYTNIKFFEIEGNKLFISAVDGKKVTQTDRNTEDNLTEKNDFSEVTILLKEGFNIDALAQALDFVILANH